MTPLPQAHRILIIEDDDAIREGLVEALTADGHAPIAAADGIAAIEAFEESPPALILLDLMLPGFNGYDLCRRFREANKQVPILMLTAKNEEIDKVLGLELGADDYITKPFSLRELLARVHSALRRSQFFTTNLPEGEPQIEVFHFGAAEVDPRSYEVRREEKCEVLSGREFELLRYFSEHPNAVLSRDELLNAVWGVNYFGTTRTLDQHVAQLRRKTAGEHGLKLIQTVHGVGYRYVPSAADIS
jgi:DNA-binding response OmpR family regulator